MKNVVWLPLAISIFTLQACKHPLAIIGEGDIIDDGGSGRGCSLEEHQAQDSACTDNDVAGAYAVNYKAVPRPGWRFVRWEGPCDRGSAFQHCGFNLSEEVVDSLQGAYPDVDLPASTAVFQAVTGTTGYLLAGTAVAGVAYETPTQLGVTGPDGSFQYEEGETVRFTIGGTVLGELAGQEKVTPFDLAGSSVPTGIRVLWALQGREDEEEDVLDQSASHVPLGFQNWYIHPDPGLHPFHTVTNLAVFLQSVDYDGDPNNGIEIAAGVASLLGNVELGLHQRWDKFLEDPAFRHLLGRGNRKHRFAMNQTMVKPAVALEFLYQSLGIDSQLVGVSEVRTATFSVRDSGEALETFSYDAGGSMVWHDKTTYGPSAFESWEYDVEGNVLRHEESAPQYAHSRMDTWQYDPEGNIAHYETISPNAFYSPQHNETSYRYDADGNRTQAATLSYREEGDVEFTWEYSYDFDDRGSLRKYTSQEESSEVRIYDAHGKLTQIGSLNTDGSVEITAEWEYDSSGRLARAELLGGEDPVILETWEYDADGRVIRYAGIGNIKYYSHRVTTWEYDALGRVIRSEHTDGDSGQLQSIGSWQYDEAGRLVLRKVVSAADDSDEELETWRYDDAGRMTNYSCESESHGCTSLYQEQIPYRTENWLYHADGTVSLREIQFAQTDNEGLPLADTIWKLHYDPAGELIREETNQGEYGSPGWVRTWSYNTDGNLTHQTMDGDVMPGFEEEIQTYKYIPTGWGYLFSRVDVFGYSTSDGETYFPPFKPRPRFVPTPQLLQPL